MTPLPAIAPPPPKRRRQPKPAPPLAHPAPPPRFARLVAMIAEEQDPAYRDLVRLQLLRLIHRAGA